MPDGREIIYTVKLQNEASAAINQLKSDLSGAFNSGGIAGYAQNVKAATASIVEHAAKQKLAAASTVEAAVAANTHARAMSSLANEIANTTSHIDTHGNHIQRSLKEYREAEGGIHLLENAVKGFIAVLAGNEILNMIDEYQTLTNRIRVVTESEDEATAVRSRLVDVTMETHTTLETTVEVYEKLREATKGYGKTQNDAINLTKTLNEAFTLGTGSAERGAQAVRYFSLALQNGQIHGIEFNAILRQAPQLTKAIEEAMGNKPAGYLKEMIREGKLGTGELLDAVQRAGPKIAAEFAKIPITLKSGFSDFKTAAFVALGEVGEKLGSSSSIGKLFENMAKALRDPTLLQNIGNVAQAIGKVLKEAMEALSTTITTLRNNTGLLSIAFGTLAIVLSVGWINGAVLAFDTLGKTGKSLPGIFGLVEKAFLGLRTAALANPWILLGTAIVAVIGMLYVFGPSIANTTKMLKDLFNIIAPMAAIIGGIILVTYASAIASGVATVATYAWAAACIAVRVALQSISANPLGAILTIIALVVVALAGLAVAFGSTIHEGIHNWSLWEAQLSAAAVQMQMWGEIVKSVLSDTFDFVKSNAMSIGNMLMGIATGNSVEILKAGKAIGASAGPSKRTSALMAKEQNWQEGGKQRYIQQEAMGNEEDIYHPFVDNITNANLNVPGALENHAKRPVKQKKEKADPAGKAIEELKDFIKKLQEANKEARLLADAEWIGPKALREAQLYNAESKAISEETMKLEKAKKGLSKTTQGARLIEAAGAVAREAEAEKQLIAAEKILVKMREAAKQTMLDVAVQKDAMAAYVLSGKALEDFNQQAAVKAYVTKALAPIVKDQADAELISTKALIAAKDEQTRAEIRLATVKRNAAFADKLDVATRDATAAGTAEASIKRLSAAAQAAGTFLKENNGTTDQRALRDWTDRRAQLMEGLKAKNDDGTSVFSKEQRDVVQKRIDSLKPPTTLFEAMRSGFVGFIAELKPSLASVGDMVKGIGNKMTDAFVQLATTGKASFADLARSIIADLLAMIVKALLFKAIMGLVNAVAPGLGSTISSVMGVTGATSAITGSAGPVANLMSGAVKTTIAHTGGVVGDSFMASNTVNSLMFGGAQRHHSGGLAGLGTNEVPIIAEKGEAILPTVRLPNGKMGVMAAGMGASGGGGTSVQANINIINGSSGGGGDNMSPEMKAKMGRLIEEEMNTHLSRKLEQWQRPGGPLDRSKR